jgi:hypothetical protein
MTRFLCSEKHPEGYKLEDLLMSLRAELIHRCEAIAADNRPEALHVMNNNLKILCHMSESITLALDSTRMLDRRASARPATRRPDLTFGAPILRPKRKTARRRPRARPDCSRAMARPRASHQPRPPPPAH